ncbi:MAG: GNAT family N-acetyltransferase [Phycisphaerales bacterium]|nr:GNAT family N-acetyltransferase [Phycisphaerales bacterium]
MILSLQRLEIAHAARFLDAVARSAKLHDPWVRPPNTPDAFREFVEKYRGDRNISYVAVTDDRDLVGCINLSEIIRGPLQSAFLGFYVFVPFEGQGLMKQSMCLVLDEAFTTHRLHRLEANIQPDNEPSKGLVRSLGFRREGFSPRYLKLGGEWRDHERYAITVEEWTAEHSAI